MQMLANIAEIELSQIYRIETGKINPKLTTILKIATALEVDVKELFKKGLKAFPFERKCFLYWYHNPFDDESEQVIRKRGKQEEDSALPCDYVM